MRNVFKRLLVYATAPQFERPAQYIVVRASQVIELEQGVNRMLSEGYECTGGIFIQPGRIECMQAMVRDAYGPGTGPR